LVLNETHALIGFAAADFLSVPRVRLLREYFGSLLAAWESADELAFAAAGIPQKSAANFMIKRATINPDQILEKIKKVSAKIITFEDDNYPRKLLQISSPPPVLFIRGDVSQIAHSFAVVGSRRVSVGGEQITKKLVPNLVQAGLAIVSGLARGVDAIAHKATLDCGGQTVAVLGNGIDAIYPSSHSALAARIIEQNGAVVSEFVPGTKPFAYNFPRRNRIVAGMSMGTLVIEGAEKSGSLITAKFALEEGREVFAVPGGPLAPLSAGPNRLIQRGEAKLVLSADDILSELPIANLKSESVMQQLLPTDPIEQTVFELLESEPLLFDDLVQKSAMPASQFSATLTLLEMKGFAHSFGGNRWARK
jgi:DNA processing protein